MPADNFNKALRAIASAPPCYLDRLSSGRYVFVGREVPAHLAFVTKTNSRPTPTEAAIACYVGPDRANLVRRTFTTKRLALKAQRAELEIEPPPAGWELLLLSESQN